MKNTNRIINNINSQSTTLTNEKRNPLISQIKKDKEFKFEQNLNFIPFKDFIIPISNINTKVNINEISEDENNNNNKILGIKRKIHFSEESES